METSIMRVEDVPGRVFNKVEHEPLHCAIVVLVIREQRCVLQNVSFILCNKARPEKAMLAETGCAWFLARTNGSEVELVAPPVWLEKIVEVRLGG